MNFKWKVQPAPAGPYAAFYARGWPMCEDEHGNTIAQILCNDEYVPSKVKTGNHAPLRILVSVGNPPEEWREKGCFTWRYLKGEFNNINEAKSAFKKFYDAHPQFDYGKM